MVQKSDRVNSFANTDADTEKNTELPELTNFKPKTDRPLVPPKAEIDELAETTGFHSRKAHVAEAEPVVSTQRKMGPRRRTNKTEPLSIKVSKVAMDEFYILADETGETLGDTFEAAVNALKELRKKSKK